MTTDGELLFTIETEHGNLWGTRGRRATAIYLASIEDDVVRTIAEHVASRPSAMSMVGSTGKTNVNFPGLGNERVLGRRNFETVGIGWSR